MSICTKTKDPDANLDYAIDWSDWLDTGDTIATSTWLVPTGLTAGTDSNTTTSATIWLSGGKGGVSYLVTNRITTTAGRETDRSFTVSVQER